MNNQVGPAFGTATGYTFVGTSGDSGSLANESKGKVETGDVFVSASPAKNALLEGAANGNWVSWYATFAVSPLVIGYNPKSRFAAQLATKPATDPKGALAVQALDRAASAHDQPALAQAATSTANVFAENTLVGRLQAAQLDAGFFYGVE